MNEDLSVDQDLVDAMKDTRELADGKVYDFGGKLYPLMKDLMDQGLVFRDIAKYLNVKGITTFRGKPWKTPNLKYAFERYEKALLGGGVGKRVRGRVSAYENKSGDKL